MLLQALDLGRRERHLLDETGQLVLLYLERSHHRLASLDIDNIILVEQACSLHHRLVRQIVILLKQLQLVAVSHDRDLAVFIGIEQFP